MTWNRSHLAQNFAKQMQCNCDLDNWQPTLSTGHSHVCRIHKAAVNWREGDPLPNSLQAETRGTDQ